MTAILVSCSQGAFNVTDVPQERAVIYHITGSVEPFSVRKLSKQKRPVRGIGVDRSLSELGSGILTRVVIAKDQIGEHLTGRIEHLNFCSTAIFVAMDHPIAFDATSVVLDVHGDD